MLWISPFLTLYGLVMNTGVRTLLPAPAMNPFGFSGAEMPPQLKSQMLCSSSRS
jgi:hypothetical protein